MKYTLMIVGGLMSTIASINIYRIMFTDHDLIDRGANYVWGNIAIILVGLFLFYIGSKGRGKNT